MPIITNSNAIPKKFTSNTIVLSTDGEKRLKNFLRIKELVPGKGEMLGIIFKASMECCESHFGKNMTVSFGHDYRRNGLDVRSDASSIFINDTLLESLSHFITVVIYHSLDFDNPEVSLYCYRQLLFIINEECNNTYLLPSENEYVDLIEKYPDLKTLNVATDLYWGMITYLILHELSHIFLNHLNKEQIIAEQEYEADKEAYHIFLEMIYCKNDYKKLEFLEEYIYLAPMMIIDFFSLVTFVDGTINETRYKSYHPPHENRKNNLFKLFSDWERDLNTEAGNGLYNWYIEVVERFKNDLFNANEKGMLKSIKRNQEKKMSEENIVGFLTEVTDELIDEELMNGMFDRMSIAKLMDSHICFIADAGKTNFVLMNKKNIEAKSFKLTNIIINFKDMLDMLMELALTSAIPSSAVQAAKLALFVSYKVLKLSTKELSETTARVLLFLHQKNAYSKVISEDEVLNYLALQGPMEKDAVNLAINDLLKLKCIDIVGGEITLLEKIYFI
ncbi:MAG: hypothetical protein LBH43_10905 [Treponema sp.]|jgi:hypothetical protein|nr:hypothetical protein [Treponema sp.]